MILPAVFGFVTFKVNRSNSAIFLNSAVAMNIKTYRHRFEGDFFLADVLYLQKEKLTLVCDTLNIEHAITKCGGFLPWLFEYKKRYGIIAGAALAFFLMFYLPNLLWHIEIKGVEKIPESDVLYALNESGMRLGTYLPKINSDKIESATLVAEKRLSWISVNIDGSSAFVEVRERTDADKPNRNLPYANIIASEDAIVETIEVYSGIASVKKDTFVRKGELLINGIIQKESIGTHITYASGKITGRIYKEYEIEVSKMIETFKSTGKKHISLDFYLFSEKKSIRLPLPDYEFYKTKCDSYSFSNGKKYLPLSFAVVKISETERTFFERSISECIREGENNLIEKIKSEYPNCEIVSKDIKVTESEKGIILNAGIWLVSEIGETSEFDISE